MPLYEYELVNVGSGEVLETVSLPMAVAERDAVVLRRRALPRSLVVAGCVADPGTQAAQVLAGYKRVEERMGSGREFRQKIGHSPEVVKAVWGATEGGTKKG